VEIGLKHKSISKNKSRVKKTSCDSSPKHELFHPYYVKVSLLMNASESNNDQLYLCAGFQLLRYRSNEAKKSLNMDIWRLTWQA
jgi:hypothetical protein